MSDRKRPHPAGQRVTFKKQKNAHGAEGTSSAISYGSHENNEVVNGHPYRRPEIRATAITPNSTSYRRLNAMFNADYSAFHQDFRKAFSSMPRPLPAANGVGNRSVTVADGPLQPVNSTAEAALSPTTNGVSLIPSKRSGENQAESSKRLKTNEQSSHATSNDSSTPSNRKSLANKPGPLPKPKGSGIYKTGTWEYVTEPDDDNSPEMIAKDVKEISAITEASDVKPSKITRNSFQRMKSTLGRSSATTTPSQEPQPPVDTANDNQTPKATEMNRALRRTPGVPFTPQPGSSARRSNRARPVPNYSNFFPADTEEDSSIPVTNKIPISAEQQNAPLKRMSSSDESAASHPSTPVNNLHTRSTSASSIVKHDVDAEPDQSAKPKKSWTMIVYEVIANSGQPDMTLPEIIEGVKDRYPYYRPKNMAETLKSSPRNPLYAHSAFNRVTRPDKTLAWNLKPGNHYDKKSNKLLTPGSPRVQANSPAVSSIKPIEDVDRQATATSTGSAPTRDASTPGVNGVAAFPSPTQNGVPPLISTLTPSPLRTTEGGATEDHLNHSENEEQRLVAAQIMAESQDVKNLVAVDPVLTPTPDPTTIEPVKPTIILSSQALKESPEANRSFKRDYFVNIELRESDISKAVSELSEPSKLGCSDEDLAELARSLQEKFERATWSSKWLLEFVRDEVTKFNTYFHPVSTYISKRMGERMIFWFGQSKWNFENFAKLFAEFDDAIDLPQVWRHAKLKEELMKSFAVACDAIWRFRIAEEDIDGPKRVVFALRDYLNDRHPNRSTQLWDIPMRS